MPRKVVKAPFHPSAAAAGTQSVQGGNPPNIIRPSCKFMSRLTDISQINSRAVISTPFLF
jgi:hypothetical protein